MTRNEKIALAVGGGVVVFGGLALYFSATAKPPSSASPSATPPSTPQMPPQPPASPTQLDRTTTPTPTAASTFPPSWNQFTNVVAGHRYLIQLHSATPFDWSRVNVADIPGSFTNLRAGNPSANYYSYTLDAHVSHEVQNVMFLLGLTGYIDVVVYDLGVAT